MSTLNWGWTLLQKAKTKVSMEQKQKFSSTFSKRWWVSKGQSPLTHSAECGSLLVRRSLGELENLFAREKVLENRLQEAGKIKNYPVDDFWRLKLVFDLQYLYKNMKGFCYHKDRHRFLLPKTSHRELFGDGLYNPVVCENFFSCRKVDWKQVFNLEFAFCP